MTEHHINVTKTARYYTLGELSVNTKRVLFVLHGFAQNAKDFIKQFEPLNDGSTFIVAPEGLNRFYLKGPGGDVGVTWMTKEDRLNEIKDYVNYLDTLYSSLNIQPDIEVVALGFSQGASTVTRWVNHSANKIDKCLIFAGEVGAELVPLQETSGLKRSNNFIIYGNADEIIPPGMFVQKLEEWKSLDAEIIEFNGGHVLDMQAMQRALQ
jgi:predicted esterase